jgi:hypothetical protein
MANDEEFLERVLAEAPDEETSNRPPFEEFSPEVAAIYIVADRLADVCRGLVGLGGKKPKTIAPLPRPASALERIKNRKRRKQHEALVARVLPRG